MQLSPGKQQAQPLENCYLSLSVFMSSVPGFYFCVIRCEMRNINLESKTLWMDMTDEAKNQETA